MKNGNKWLWCCTLFCFLIITGCASTPTVTGVWKDDQYTGGGVSKVLVIGVTDKVPTMRMFEDEFVRQLKEKGVDAVASYRVTQTDRELSKGEIRAKVDELKIDAVIVTKVVAKKKEEVVHPGRTYVAPSSYHHGYYDYYSRGYRHLHSPAYIEHTPPMITEYEVLSLESNMYATKDESLIISIQSDLVAEGTADSLIKSYINTVMKELSGANLISK